MSRLAILEPKSLVGEAIREALSTRTEPWDDIELFTEQESEVGSVTEIAGRAALVQSLEDDALHGFDAVLVCGQETSPGLLDSVPAGCRAILVDSELTEGYAPAVSGINDTDLTGIDRLRSPAPGVLLLAHLLSPLRDRGSMSITAHVLQPASARGKEGMDELFAQTRSILAMSEDRPQEVFGSQLAFNLLPWHGVALAPAQDLQTVLGSSVEASVQVTQAGVFHGCTAAVFLLPSFSLEAEDLLQTLVENPLVEEAESPDQLGPVAAATSDKILIGEPSASTGGGLWLWACMDNLVASARNALDLARS